MKTYPVIIFGSGPMAQEYTKVLISLGIEPIVIGRGKLSAESFFANTQVPVISGGAENWLEKMTGDVETRVVVAVGEKWLGKVAKSVMDKGFTNILIEKPGGFDIEDIKSVALKAMEKAANVYVGYNRRYFSSVCEAKRMIQEDGGITSFNFEFTEWSHVVSSLEKEVGVKEEWFLSNTTHVVDLAFYLGGIPVEISAYTAGFLDWHGRASVFSGAGVTNRGALFSYHANWTAPGRWGLEILTNKRRLIFKPLEKLQIQQLGSIAVDTVDIIDDLDQNYKPGIYRQLCDFLTHQPSAALPTIQEQVDMLCVYKRMRGDS